MFRQMTIGRKMMASAGGLLILIAVLGALSLKAVYSLHDSFRESLHTSARTLEIIGALRVAVADVRAEQRAMLLAVAVKRDQDFQKAIVNGDQAFMRLNQGITEVRPLLGTHGGKTAIEGLTRTVPSWKETIGEMTRLLAEGRVDAANDVRVQEQRPLADRVTKLADDVLNTQKEIVDARLKQADRVASWDGWLILVVIGMSVAISAVIVRVIQSIVSV